MFLPKSLFTPTFIGRVLDHIYVLRVLWTFKEGELEIVNSMNPCEPIREWRRSNPGLVMMLRVVSLLTISQRVAVVMLADARDSESYPICRFNGCSTLQFV